MGRPAIPWKQCRCGAKYSRDEWATLPRLVELGHHVTRDPRACAHCGTVLTVHGEATASAPELPFTD
jgi:hypothetical protein